VAPTIITIMTNPQGIALKFWVPNTGALFSLAVDAAKGIQALPRVGGQSAALVSVVFAAASLEAFLSESAYLAEFNQHKVPEPAVVSTFAQVMEEAEDSKASIESKFHLANLVLSGNAYEKGNPPYQDFSLLAAARNALVHFKSKEYFSKVEGRPAVFNQAAVVNKLKSKNILHEASPGTEEHLLLTVGEKALSSVEAVKDGRIVGSENVPYKLSPEGLRARWTYLISTKAVAQWACNAAAKMALDLIEKVPTSNWKTHMESYLRPVFSVPLK
jgi:hypothetical protein